MHIPLNKLTTRDLQKQWQVAERSEKEETRTEQFYCARHPPDAAQRLGQSGKGAGQLPAFLQQKSIESRSFRCFLELAM